MTRAKSLLQGGAAVAALCLFGTTAFAQTCPEAGNRFWKNDNFPDVPAGPLALSVIPGLCEGEACGAVFTIPGNVGPQLLRQVTCPFGSLGGGQGAQALVNVEIYDGVTFSGGVPTLGTKVFDLNADTQNDMQIASTALNSLDVSQFNIVVGNTPSKKFVVAFRMNFNPNGDCPNGYTSNFFTDNSQFGFTCDPVITPPQKNLIYIQGQGWRDAATATVMGIQLCPLFYAGNWAIRACSEDAMGDPLQVNVSTLSASLGGTANFTLEAGATYGNQFYFLLGTFAGQFPGTVIDGVPVPLNPDFPSGLMPLTITYANSAIFQNTASILDGNGDGTAAFNSPPNLPPQIVGAATTWAYLVYNIQGGPFGVIFASNPVTVTYGG